MAIIKERFGFSYLHSKQAPGWDVLVGWGALVFFAPLMLAVYMAVRADGGPAFVGRDRAGRDGTIFKVWNFRTTKQQTLRTFRNNQIELTNPDFTRVGRILYRARLENLPSFYNVFKGDMSLAEMMQNL